MVLVSLHLTPLRQPRTLEPGDDDFTMLGSPRCGGSPKQCLMTNRETPFSWLEGGIGWLAC